MQIYDLLIYIQFFELKALFVALLVYSIYFARRDSFSITLLLAITLYLAHVGIQSFLNGVGNSSAFNLFGQAIDPKMVEFVLWHPTYAFTDFMFFYVVSYFLQKFNYQTNKASNYIVFMYLAHGFFQLVSFADFVVFETNYLDGLYVVIVPTLDAAMVLTVCSYVVIAVSLDVLRKRREA